ncbi:MAG: tRNA-dihydrouridine synthase family protein, partial [Verrucomicrobia bacterium]|nr:tRNA-dihydrouridine synthase family protein [Verrucomicrobiota bacterium]
MSLLPKNSHGCPYLFLAPMEGIGDRCFRVAMASVGGFDMAVRDFLRVPSNAHVKSLAVAYTADEIAPIPLVAQLMGSDPELMAAMAVEMEQRGAPRIDINCGCPSNTVTGRGAGSSLLKEPNFLHQVATAVVQAVSIPVSLKMRSGYENTSLFKENLVAAQESGVSYITLHPRTKVDGYGPPARWDLIAEAKSILNIPLVGNGDIVRVEDAVEMLRVTKCDALMIGRGSIINPFLFQQIRAHFAGEAYTPQWSDLIRYLHIYYAEIPLEMSIKSKINKMKALFGFLF